ncbi:hypothetical protein BYT27DRAFT_7337649 [Phlegmacium glaucopus]|nr:hypothetical protein BYT27DRAFT_7337649 [Phlegmacium glaucopus]
MQFSHSARTPAGWSLGPATSVPTPPRIQLPNQSNVPEASSPLLNGVYRFNHKYKHVWCDHDGPETKPQRAQLNLPGSDAIIPVLTEQGLEKISGISTDSLFELSTKFLTPTDAHIRFKRFLLDTFRFKNSYEVYAFLVPLISANCNSALWTQEEEQLLLASVASANGSLRIVEIINWPQISICAGLSKEILSFQRGILQLLRYLSSEFVIKSTMSTHTNHIFSVVLQNFEKFADIIKECMDAAIKARSFRDTRSSSPYKSIDIKIFISITTLLHGILVRFENAVATYPRLGPLVNDLYRWFRDWRTGVEATPPLFDNPFSNVPPSVREHVIDTIQERIECLVNIVERDEPRYIIKSDLEQKWNAVADIADHFGPNGPWHDSPCQEPCGWNCDHYSCPVPCGLICVRLPCDKPCKKPLKCGHVCPSMCGEDCNIQFCHECAFADQKSQVVDLILQQSLEDVLPESGDTHEMIITIPACRHVFTVAALDGLTGMTDFYFRDEKNMNWTGLLAPVGFIKPPTCPTCRSPITCPRYSRIVKRANLDILEQNIATYMFQSLDKGRRVLRTINEGTLKALLVAEAATITIPDPDDLPHLAKLTTSRNELLETGKSPAPERDIQASNSALHFMDSKVLSIWQRATHQLFDVYNDIVKITECQYTHTQAWEASFLLFEREIQARLGNLANLPRNPQGYAMRMARFYIGQPRPLADRRFLVEAFWVTLQIRLTLVGLAQTWMRKLSNSLGYSAFHLQRWVIYIDFLLQTCVRDAEKAYDIARDSGSHRQVVKTMLLRMRIDLEVFRFNLSICRHYETTRDHRETLLAMVNKRGAEAIVQMRDTENAYFSRKEIRSPQEERVWVEDNFTSTAEIIVNEQMQTIRRSMNFARAGHFYQCINGHALLIKECGGAMQRSTCPECGGVIGWSGHTPTARSDEFDRLARRLNVER